MGSAIPPVVAALSGFPHGQKALAQLVRASIAQHYLGRKSTVAKLHRRVAEDVIAANQRRPLAEQLATPTYSAIESAVRTLGRSDVTPL